MIFENNICKAVFFFSNPKNSRVGKFKHSFLKEVFMVATLCFVFVALVGVMIGVMFDREYGPNNVIPD